MEAQIKIHTNTLLFLLPFRKHDKNDLDVSWSDVYRHTSYLNVVKLSPCPFVKRCRNCSDDDDYDDASTARDQAGASSSQ
jgi:hypothetical protein